MLHISPFQPSRMCNFFIHLLEKNKQQQPRAYHVPGTFLSTGDAAMKQNRHGSQPSPALLCWQRAHRASQMPTTTTCYTVGQNEAGFFVGLFVFHFNLKDGGQGNPQGNAASEQRHEGGEAVGSPGTGAARRRQTRLDESRGQRGSGQTVRASRPQGGLGFTLSELQSC